MSTTPAPAKWGIAFLRQAQADLQATETLLKHSSAVSPASMMLQMVFEKLAKAYRLKAGESFQSVYKSKHRTADKLIHTLRLQSAVFQDQLGGPSGTKWKQWLGELKNLEDAQPSNAKKGQPQLEYPWQHGSQVRWPENHLPLAQKLADQRTRLAAELVRLAHTLIQNY